MGYCTQSPWEHPGPGIAQRYRSLHSDQRADGNMVSGTLITAAARYTGDGADRAMQAYRTGLGLCESHPTTDMTLTFVPAAGVTAADVMVVRSVVPGRTMYFAFVRQGDVVEELAFYDGSDEVMAVAVTAQAAQRLCAAVPTC
jgi:hypothetical protein